MLSLGIILGWVLLILLSQWGMVWRYHQVLRKKEQRRPVREPRRLLSWFSKRVCLVLLFVPVNILSIVLFENMDHPNPADIPLAQAAVAVLPENVGMDMSSRTQEEALAEPHTFLMTDSQRIFIAYEDGTYLEISYRETDWPYLRLKAFHWERQFFTEETVVNKLQASGSIRSRTLAMSQRSVTILLKTRKGFVVWNCYGNTIPNEEQAAVAEMIGTLDI